MKTKNIYKIILISILIFSTLFGNEKVAVTIKSKGIVKFKKETDKKFDKKLQVGSTLENKSEITVGKKSFASIIFIDDKSMLNIHENTNFIVRRDVKNSKIIKRISMEYGKVLANVNKDRNNEFIISTPTSVAAVKGTIFWVISDESDGDTFYGIEGSVEITNLASNKVVILGKNEKGTSTKDGKLDKEPIKPNQVPQAQTQEAETKVIRVQYKNDEGEIKYLEINYKE